MYVYVQFVSARNGKDRVYSSDVWLPSGSRVVVFDARTYQGTILL